MRDAILNLSLPCNSWICFVACGMSNPSVHCLYALRPMSSTPNRADWMRFLLTASVGVTWATAVVGEVAGPSFVGLIRDPRGAGQKGTCQ